MAGSDRGSTSQTYINGWRRRRDAQASRRAERRRMAFSEAERLAPLLLELGARRVILFGSLAGPPDAFHERSDIDLATEGLPPELHVTAYLRLEAATTFAVDLVLLEQAPAELARSILADGKELGRGQ